MTRSRLQDIAERSTINRATFYSHFVDKHDLFSHFARDWFREALQARLPVEEGISRDNLRRLVLTTMEASLETVIASTSWGIFGAALSWSQSENHPSAEQEADHIAGLVIGGLAGSAFTPGLEPLPCQGRAHSVRESELKAQACERSIT